jgi:membrane-associated phospholipid phosphatase
MSSDPDDGRRVVRRRIDVIAATAGGMLFLSCAVIARNGRVSDPERWVFEVVNGLPSALEPFANVGQFLGTLAVGPVVALIALCLRRWRLAVGAVLVTVFKLWAERGVWQLITRERPGVTEPNAVVRAGAPATGVSFVSGHVMLVTGLAWVVAPYLRGRWRVVPWVVVVLVAFARIYLGAHNPLDVLGGFGLGLVIGSVANLLIGVPTPARWAVVS